MEIVQKLQEKRQNLEDIFLLENCIYFVTKPTGKTNSFLVYLFNILSHKVCQKFDPNCKKKTLKIRNGWNVCEL